MQGLKSAIFQKSADWLDWPCLVSAALQFRPQKMRRNGCISFYQSIMNQNYHQNLCLVLCRSDPNPSSVKNLSWKSSGLVLFFFVFVVFKRWVKKVMDQKFEIHFFEFSVEFRVGLYFISFSQLIVFLYMKKTTGIIPTVVFRHNGWAIFWRSIFDL